MTRFSHLLLLPLVICLSGSAASARQGTGTDPGHLSAAKGNRFYSTRIIVQGKNKKSDCKSIQKALDALPAEGGEVLVQAGTYSCTEPVVIDRDNVEVRGEGPATLLRLADGANAPLLILGQTMAVPDTTRTNITVSDLALDGNRQNQTFECFKGDCTPSNPLRNNGVTLRRVSDARVDRVTVRGARSGGLVSELACRRLTIRDFTSYDSEFDGLAGYETEDSVYSGLYLHNNLAAGFSFDIAFNNNIISDTVISGNGKVGIFMRDSRDNIFRGLQIRNNGEHGIFLAQVDTDATKPAAGNTFIGVTVSGSSGAGLRVNDLSCVNNAVIGSQFVANSAGCISEASPGLAIAVGTVCR
jgi:parallel beta-helix repeat protein